VNLFIIENDATVDQVLATPAYDPKEDLIVCFNYLPYDKLLNCTDGHNVHFMEEFLSGEDYNNLHRATDDFAGRWYMVDGKDATLFNGVSFGDITQIMLSRTYLISILVKYGEVVRKIIEQYRDIGCICYDLSNSSNSFFFNQDDGGKYFDKEDLIKSVADQLNITSRYLRPSRVIPPAFIGSIDSTTGKTSDVKRQLFDVFRLCLLRFMQAARRFVRNGNKQIYFFNYFNIDSLSEKAGMDFMFSTPDKKRLSTLVRSFDFNSIRYEHGEREEEFMKGLRNRFVSSLSFDYGNRFVYNGIDYSRFYFRAIERIVEKHIPSLLKYYRQVQRGIEEFNIGKVVLVDIMTETGRILVEACRSASCESIFIDHGIMGYRFAQRASRGYAPDLVIKPDDLDTNAEGYPYMIKTRSIQLGNPSTDPYPENRRRRISSIKTILIHTFSDNFYARLDRFQYQEAYFKELFLAIPKLYDMGMKILYRPHHENMDYHRYLFNYFNVDPAIVTISDFSEPFRELIYQVDLLVCNVSNTFYESLAAGVPVVFLEPHFNPNCLYPPLNGNNWEEVIRVSRAAELIDIVERNKEDPAELTSFVDGFIRDHSARYMSKLDGMAGNRIADYLNRN